MFRQNPKKRLISIICALGLAAVAGGTVPSLAEGGLTKSLSGIVQQLLGKTTDDESGAHNEQEPGKAAPPNPSIWRCSN